jgi:hypothetical protein
MSAFIAIAEAIKAKLLEAPQIVGDRVERARQASLKKGWSNGIAVRLVRTNAQLAGVGLGAPKDWDTVFGIECVARADVGGLAEDAVDPVLAAAYARLAGAHLGLPALLDVMAEPAISWDTDEGENQICRATFVVTVTHRTAAASLTAWGS